VRSLPIPFIAGAVSDHSANETDTDHPLAERRATSTIWRGPESQRLFLPGEHQRTIEVIDLREGKVIHTITGFEAILARQSICRKSTKSG
jgi:hypothetical protein